MSDAKWFTTLEERKHFEERFWKITHPYLVGYEGLIPISWTSERILPEISPLFKEHWPEEIKTQIASLLEEFKLKYS